LVWLGEGDLSVGILIHIGSRTRYLTGLEDARPG
jgi:hypothetical protein